MNKFGLYAIDASQNNSPIGNQATLNWKRTGLQFGDRVICRTNIESNKYGTYNINDGLILNGDRICSSSNILECNVNNAEKSVLFGDNILSSDNVCINVTVDIYNKLRCGIDVEGYSKYSPDTVYYIVESGDTSKHYYYKNRVMGHKDIIYNSFLVETGDNEEVGHLAQNNGVDVPKGNTISIKTYTDPRNTPEIAMREFNTFFNAQEGGTPLVLEYYVDGPNYDSNSVHEDNGNIIYGIGETFTTIIEDAFGNEIYRKTTYAGQFRVTTAPTTAVGKTYFSIRTIDSEGRESVTLFYDIYIKESFNEDAFLIANPNLANTYDSEGKYRMTFDDISHYGFTIFSFSDETDTDIQSKWRHNNIADNPEYRTNDDENKDKRSHYLDGYINKLALERLMLEKKALGYTGVILYNKKENSSGLNDDDNSVYLLDCHPVATSKILSTGVTSNNEIATTPYYTIDKNNYSNSDFVPDKTLYFVQAKRVDGVLGLYNPKTGEPLPTKEIISGNSTYHIYLESGFDDCEIVKNEEKDSFGNDTVTVYKDGTPVTYSLKKDESIYDWVCRDGAEIRRSLTDNNIIKVIWGTTGTTGNDTHASNEAYCGGYTPKHVMLSIKKLSLLTGGTYHKEELSSILHTDVDNYPYFYFGKYTTKGDNNVRNLNMLDDFVLDCNNCTLLSTFGYDLYYGVASCMVNFRNATNSHIKNAKLVGLYGSNIIKKGFLHYFITNASNGIWESCKCVTLNSAVLCSLQNVHIENSPGYELTSNYHVSAPIYTDNYTRFITTCSTKQAAIAQFGVGVDSTISPNGESISGTDAVIQYDGQSILPSDSADINDGATDVCLATTTSYTNISSLQSVSRSAGFTSTANKVFNKDSIYLAFRSYFTYTTREGKFNLCFLHLFRKQNGEYIFVRTYKTRAHNQIRIPSNVNYIRTTNYVSGYVNDNEVSLVAKGSGSSYQVLGATTTDVVPVSITRSCTIDSCIINVTKAGAMVGPSINNTVKNTDFIDVCAMPYKWTYTLATGHHEEAGGLSHHLSVINCTSTRTNAGELYSGINFYISRYPVFKNCKSIAIGGTITQYFIDNCSLNSISAYCNRHCYNKVLGVVNNTSTFKEGTYAPYGLTQITTSDKYQGTVRNLSDETLQINVIANDSMLYIKRNNEPIRGRAYMAKNNLYGSAIENSINE